MKFLRLRHIVGSIFVSLLFLPASLMAQHGLSHVRVVRLSYTSGTVAIKRPQSTEWVKATVNTPIQEGFALSTSSNSFAEVEFENGSTARLGELSKVDFAQLAMDSAGNKLNRLVFEGGYATFHFLPEHKDVYTVKAGDVTISPHAKVEFRTDLDADQLRVEVLNGSAEIAAPSGSTKLGKDETLTFNTRTEVASNIQHGIQSDAWDKWVESRDTQAELAQKDSPVGLKGSLYGWSDLDAYGDWAFFPGYGYGWAPYEPIGWSPYTVGMWDWYSPLAGPGLVASRGAGCPITTGSGTTTPCSVGSGCPVHSACGRRRWSIGMQDRAGSAGCLPDVNTATALWLFQRLCSIVLA